MILLAWLVRALVWALVQENPCGLFLGLRMTCRPPGPTAPPNKAGGYEDSIEGEVQLCEAARSKQLLVQHPILATCGAAGWGFRSDGPA